MSNSPKEGFQRIVDVEKLRTRRRTLKRLLLGSGIITTGGVIHAQQDNAAKSIAPVLNLLLDDTSQCPTEPEHDLPADSAVTPAEAFTLSAGNYTGTASRSVLVTAADLECPVLITVTFSVCAEVVSSVADQASLSLDIIAITEGLSAINENNDDPAVDYYFRSIQPRSNANTESRKSLLELTVNRESVNNYTAHGGSRNGLRKSCGFTPVVLPFTLNIENNQPTVTFQERSVNNDIQYTLPKTKLMLSADACSHPDRVESSCSVTNDDGSDGGIVILTTPPPGPGPIL
jgi:hypothetical protein